MKKRAKYALIFLVFFIFPVILLGLVKGYELYIQNDVKNYLQSLSRNGLDHIEVWANGDTTEIYDEDFQEDIIKNISNIELSIASKHSINAPGSVGIWITLIYQNGKQEEISLPIFKYETIFGPQYFDCTIDQNNPLLPFSVFF